jgi:hypothetical protein
MREFSSLTGTAVFLGDDALEFFNERRKIALNDRPDNIEINVDIAVDQAVPRAAD